MITVVLPPELDIEGLPDFEKVKNTHKFYRRVGKNHQDHGTKGNIQYPSYREPNLEVRRILRRGGLVEFI